ncbi:MAG: PAS domain-containing protein [Lachnospiraceae bacterium]|nr:PAS domain-containing protein [Lachnospiraceae bacterium]
MYKKIFRSSFLTAFLVLVAAIALIMGILFHFFEAQIQTELENEAGYLSQAVEKAGIRFFDGFEKQSGRVTLTDAEGKVLFDSDTEAEKLDNHADREEINAAMKNGTGKSIRYSQTLTEKTVNYAVKLSDGSILRVSTTQYTVAMVLLRILQPVLVVLAAALVLTLVLSLRVSKAIIEPINNLDLESPENNVAYEELAPLLKKLAKQNRTIEEQLADAHKKQVEFHLITENMSEGFLVIDRDASLLTYNSAALGLFGITRPASGNVLTFCRAKDFRDTISKVLAGEKAENTMMREGCCYSIIANPVFEKKEVIGAVIIILDITEREKRETLRREFTANVSHELKTPLTSISGFAELMKEGGVPEDTVVDFSASIYDEAQRLVTLVTDIIKISELDGKSTHFQRENVDLYELSEEIISRLEDQAEKRNITINLIGSKTEITGVRKILDEMFYNLLDNAVKYNKENGTVDFIISNEENVVAVLVRDTGTGIPAVHQSRVFERFYRVDKSHSKRIGGTGLGLAIVKHGAIYHNAEIRLESTEGKGTAVTVQFRRDSFEESI